MSLKARMSRKALNILNKILPKYNRVLVVGFPNAESSAVEVANYIKENYDFPVYYGVSNQASNDPKHLLHTDIIILDSSASTWSKLEYILKSMMSKYLFLTHSLFLDSFSKRQVVVNIWHGVLYKKVGKLIGGNGVPANITVGTSRLTKKMFSEAFGVPLNTVLDCGYPRNDILIQSKNSKTSIKDNIDPNFNKYSKIIIWLPTYRRNKANLDHIDGSEIGNPFYIKDFDMVNFNRILQEQNTYCIVKPHPLAIKYEGLDALSHILFIDDKWITEKGITLYKLLGITDVLISDISSVMIDYLLMDQPIICVSEDFEEYKNTRGFYFEDIENWLPSPILKNQTEFFENLKTILSSENDLYFEKRQKLKELFFTYHDGNSTERLVRSVF